MHRNTAREGPSNGHRFVQKILYLLDVQFWRYAHGQTDRQTDKQTDRQTEMLDTILHSTTGDCTKRCVKILPTTAQLQEQVVQQIQNKAK